MPHSPNIRHVSDAMEPPVLDATPAPAHPAKWQGLSVRAVSSGVLLLLVLADLWLGGFYFYLLVILAALQMQREWDRLNQGFGALWRVVGLAYISLPCASLIWLRGVSLPDAPQAGSVMLMYVLCIVWATDIGAYFTGRTVGGPKLAPTISPGKTWAGLGGGIAAAAVVGGIGYIFSPFPTKIYWAILLGALLAVVAQAGDLFESWLKRRAGVKDSGTLIPGHGGLLDRADGMIFTLPLFALLVYSSGILS
jgi:phosphatidate cytidylyltransferase